MNGIKEKLAEFSENFLAREAFGIETISTAHGSDEPLTLGGLRQLNELIKPRFHFDPVKIEPFDPVRTIIQPYSRFLLVANHHAILYGTVAMPDDLPKKKMSAKEFYKSERRVQQLLKRYWALKVGEVLLKVIEKRISLWM